MEGPHYEESTTKADGKNQSESDDIAVQTRTKLPVLAYQKYFFNLQGPLVSPSVKFSEKKSIIGDDDDD